MAPKSAAFHDEARPRLIAMAADGRVVVPVARTFALDAAPEALALLQSGHPGGKLALLP
jgi:NADPH:quinone reductase